MKAIRCLQLLSALSIALCLTSRVAVSQLPATPRHEPPTIQETDSVPLIMSVSGAISVGAYQAGVNWAILEFLRRARHDTAFRHAHKLRPFALRTVTGASAGNINALLWAIEWCTGLDSTRPWNTPPPDSSLFWKTWVGFGLDALLPNEDDDPRMMEKAIFDRSRVRDITYPPIFARLKSHELRPNCQVPLGITITRTQPDVITYQGLEIETQRFATIFLATVVEGSRVEPDSDRMHFLQLATPVQGEGSFGKVVRLLPQDSSIRIGTQQVLMAVQASAAFPIALAPVPITVWYPAVAGSGQKRESVFIDGGVFDNNPITLALALYHHVDTSRVGAHGIYINPFRYRGELDRARVNTALSATGGIAAFTEFLGGAINTGRQYELQLFVRERHAASIARASSDSVVAYLEKFPGVDTGQVRRRLEQGQSASLHDTLSFTSRSYPIYGEHLNAFAAFLGRPLREFDFYVGAYDGLYFAAREFMCGDRTADAAQTCTRQKMATLVRDSAMIPVHARRLLATLYNRENYPDRGPENQRPLTFLLQASSDRNEQKIDRILLALYRGASTQLAPRRPADCDPLKGDIGQFLCSDGIGPMLQRFQHDSDPDAPFASAGDIESILEEWSSSCTSTPIGNCRAEKDFLELIRRPTIVAPRLLERVLGRMEEVEQTLKQEGQPDYAKAVAAINALYHTSTLRPRQPLELSPSLPTYASRWWLLVPYSVGGPVGWSGWEFRDRPAFNKREIPWLDNAINKYRPIRFVGSAIDAFTVPVTFQYDHDHRLNKLTTGALGVGLGVARRSPLAGAGFFLNEVGLEGHVLTPVGREGHRLIPVAHLDSAWAFAEIYGTFVGGFLRSSLRLDTHHFNETPRFISVTIALADLPGLVYWWRRTR